MALPKTHNIHFTTIYLHIANEKDIPAIAKELVGAIRFVKSKVTQTEYKRLIELVEAFSGPMYFPLYPAMVRHVIAGYERVLTFNISQLFRFSLNKDLELFRLFYRGLECFLPCDKVTAMEKELKNPLHGKYKDYKAAACFAQNWAEKDSDELRLIYTEFIEFCLFQFQLLTKKRLSNESADTVRKMKGDSTFWGKRYRKLDTKLAGNKLLNKFIYLYGDVSQGFKGGGDDEGFTCKCRELVKQFFYSAPTDPKLNETALTEQILIEPLLWNTPQTGYVDNNITRYSLIKGNRLTVDEKLHLPMRSNMMMPHELSALLKAIKQMGNDDIHLAYLLTLLVTSKPRGYVDSLLLSRVPLHFEMGDYIDITRGIWLRSAVHTVKAFAPSKEQQAFVHPHRGGVELPLPKILVQALERYMKENKLVVTTFATSDVCWLSNPLRQEQVFLDLHRSVTGAMVRSSMFMHLTRLTDPNYAALILANTEYVQFTHLYYLSRSHNDVISTYTGALMKWGLECEVAEQHQNDFYTGSKMAIKVERLAESIKTVMGTVKKMMAKCEGGEVATLIQAHNSFALYTVFMMICATTHRPRIEFNFTDFTCTDTLCLLADKVSFEDSKVRINPLPPMVAKQVEAYRNHCRLIAKVLPSVLEHIKVLLFDISRNRSCGVATFGIIDRSHQWQPIGKTEVESLVRPVVPLPLNIFRHHLASQLRKHDFGDYAQQLMGHIGTGEHSLSAFSPCRLADLTQVAGAIDYILAESGFEVIECAKPRGTMPKLKSQTDIYQGSLNVPNRDKYRWLNQWSAGHVQSYVGKRLKNHVLGRPPAKSEIIAQACLKFEDKNEQRLVAKFVGHFVDRVNRPATQANWNDLASNELELDADTIFRQKQAEIICKFAHDYIKDGNAELLPFNLMLSLIVNGGFGGSISPAMLTAVKQQPIKQNNLYWVSWKEDGQQMRVLFDSISLCIVLQSKSVDNLTCHQLSRHYELFKLKLARVDGIDPAIVQLLVDLSALANFLAGCFDKNIPASLRYYRAGMVETTCLSDRSMARFISHAKFHQAPVMEAEEGILLVTTLKYRGYCSDDQLSRQLIKNISGTLNEQNKVRNVRSVKKFVTNTILTAWQQATKCNSLKLADLVRASSDIAPTTVGVLIWLLDVANKPGRSGGEKVIRTTTTYLSNVVKPLLEEDINFNFFDLDDQELEDLYQRTLDARNIENRGERAALLRRFHRYMMDIFYLPEVDWYEIEPTIDAKEHKVNANIISMADYERTIELLKSDKHSSKVEAQLNVVCLILCYRLGLRSGEVRGLELVDIDTRHWIIHVRTNRNGRKKSLRSNRRIPAALLLSETEKQQIKNYVEHLNSVNYVVARGYVPVGVSLCSSSADRTTLINFANVIKRVIEALRLATADETLRLHHARHSCATYLKLTVEYDRKSGVLAKQLKSWARTDDLAAFANALRRELTGFENITHRCMPALTTLIGHAKVQTTARYYIHCYDLQLFEYCEYKLQQHYPTKFIADMVNIDDAYARQTIKRSKMETGKFNHLLTKVIDKGHSYDLQTLSNDLDLVAATELTEKCQRDELFDELNKIHIVLQFFHIREKTKYIHDLFNIPEDYSKQVLAAAKNLAEQTKYTGYILPPDSMFRFKSQLMNFKVEPMVTQNYFATPAFRVLTARLSQLIYKQKYTLEDIYDIWIKHYDPKYELTVCHAELKSGLLLRLSESLGLIFTVEDIAGRENKKLGQYGDKRVKLKWEKASRNSINGRFNYLMFVCGVYFSNLEGK